MVITGLAASAVRAGLMLTLYLTGRVLRRMTDGYNTLAAAAFCMLVFNPLYLFDIGFQLSYLAVLSILYLQPRLQNLIVVRNPVIAIPWGWITVFVLFPAVLVGFPVYQFTFDVPGYLPYSGRTDLVIASCRYSWTRIITIIRREADAYIVLDCRCL